MTPVARRGRPALRLLPALARAGVRHRRPVHEGGRRALRQARGRPRDGTADRADDPRRRPGDGAHRLHPAERARPRRLPRPGSRRHRLTDPRRRPRGRGGRRVRGRDGDGARRRRGPGHQGAHHPHHRHRRRPRLRRPGARLAGRLRPAHRQDGEVRQAVRRRARRPPRSRPRLRRRGHATARSPVPSTPSDRHDIDYVCVVERRKWHEIRRRNRGFVSRPTTPSGRTG